MCDCIEQIEAEAQKQSPSYRINRTLPLRAGQSPRVVITFVPKPGAFPKRGEECPAVHADYCPFCGEKYGEPRRAGEEASDA